MRLSDQRRSAFGLALGWTALLAVAALLTWWAPRGIDLTDEAYYLAWIARPEAYSATIHPFGIFFNVAVWKWLPSVVALRLFGVALIAGSAAIAAHWARRYYRSHGLAIAGAALLPVAALAALSYYAKGIVTPSYNLLANAGGALFAAGLFGWFEKGAAPSSRDDGASLLVGFGACLAFLGKPTLAAFVAAMVAIILLANLRRHPPLALRRGAITAFACFAPLLLFLAATVGVRDFLATIVAGIGVLDFGNSLPRLVLRAPNELYHAPAYLAAAATAALLTFILAARAGEAVRALRLVNLGLLAYLVLCLAYEVATGLRGGGQLWTLLGAPILALALATPSYGASLKPDLARNLAAVAPLFLLPMLALATAFGTSNPWLGQTGASLFPPLLAILLSARLFLAPARALLVDILVTTGVLLVIAFAAYAPYRLSASIAAQTHSARLPFMAGTLLVDGRTATFIQSLNATAVQWRISQATPIIDLSNQGPGTALLLGGRAPWFPWLNANYPNAVPLADAAWAALDGREQRASWFVTPVAAPLESSQANRYFRAHAVRYALAGRLLHPQTGQAIELWRPQR